jgi:transposase
MKLVAGILRGFLETLEVAMSDSRCQLWAGRMKRYRASSLTVHEFCRREGVSVPSFYQWRKKLAHCPAEPTFIPVSLPPSGAAPITLKLPGGAEIEIEASVDPLMLRRLIAAVMAETVRGVDR